MSSDIFLQLRLVGGRFSNHSIPLDALTGIARIKALIVEASRLEYLKHQATRKEAIRGFEQSVDTGGFARSIELKITSITRGSTQVNISMETSGNPPTSADQESYISLGRDRLIGTIQRASSGEEVQHSEVSEKMAHDFDKIAGAIRDNEAIQLIGPASSGSRDKMAVFTRRTAVRLRSTAMADRNILKEIEICGAIFELNLVDNTAQLQLRNGTKVTAYIAPTLLDTAIDLFNGYRNNQYAYFRCVGRIDPDGNLLEINSILAITIINLPHYMQHQLSNMRELRDGWLDGEGKALSQSGMNWIEAQLSMYITEGVPVPYLYPTVDGGIQMEWSIASSEVSLEVNFESRSGVWHELDLKSGKDHEKELRLAKAVDWKWIVGRMNHLRSMK